MKEGGRAELGGEVGGSWPGWSGNSAKVGIRRGCLRFVLKSGSDLQIRVHIFKACAETAACTSDNLAELNALCGFIARPSFATEHSSKPFNTASSHE